MIGRRRPSPRLSSQPMMCSYLGPGGGGGELADGGAETAGGRCFRFFLWSLVGLVLPILGLIAVVLYRGEQEEPERRCPTCNNILKLHVQVCPRCGTDLYLPDPSEVRPGPADRGA